jgi:5-methylcytosine-specific restriction endonuclease McrA
MYGKEWKKIKEKHKETCFICGTAENLHLHHKIRYKKGGTNEDSNLIVLCNKHHAKFHTLENFYINNHARITPERILNQLKEKNKLYK